MQRIDPADLIPLDVFAESEPLKVDVVYADAHHPRNIFDADIYRKDMRLWAHKDLAAVTLLTARTLKKTHNYSIEVKDCLRTVDSQTTMQKTDIVKAHPEWMIEPRMLAPPGAGAHPRAMAIDVCVYGQDDQEVDMGTLFDDMDKKSYRSCTDLTDEQLNNRKVLETTFVESAKKLGFDLLPIPSEWWDFRFYPEFTDAIAPLNDDDLPLQMQQTKQVDNGIDDFDENHFQKLVKEILETINNV